MNSIEYLAQMFQSGHLLQILWLHHTILLVLGTSRVNNINKNVSPTNLFQKAYAVLVSIAIISMYVHLEPIIEELYAVCCRYVVICIMGLAVLHPGSYFVHMINVTFLNNANNVDFVLYLDKLDRRMEIHKKKPLYDPNHKFNTVISIVYFVAILAYASISLVSGVAIVTLIALISTISEGTVITDLGLCSNLMLYFSIRMRFLNAIISNYLYRKEACQYVDVDPNNIFLRTLAEESHDFEYSDTDIYLRDILEGFSKMEKLYRFQVLIYCSKFIIGIALYLEMIILITQKNMLHFVELMLIMVFSLSHWCVVFLLCIRSEDFIREVQRTKTLCITVMSIHTEGPLRRKARQMIKIIETAPPRFSVYGIWLVDAQLLVKLFGTITILMVTLIQFALI